MEEYRDEGTIPRFTFRTSARAFNRDADQNILLGRAVSVAGKSYKIMLGGVLAGIVLLTALTILLLVSGDYTVALMCAMGIFLLGYMLYREKTEGEVKAAVKQAKKAHGVMQTAELERTVTVEFRDEGCRWAWGEGRKDVKWYDYDDFTRLFETEDLFFLSCPRAPGFCVRKTDLSGGTVDEFRAWTQEKCGRPFRYYEINDPKWQDMLK